MPPQFYSQFCQKNDRLHLGVLFLRIGHVNKLASFVLIFLDPKFHILPQFLHKISKLFCCDLLLVV